MWRILRLRREFIKAQSSDSDLCIFCSDVWILCSVHLISKVGIIASDSITSYKLIEKGLRRDQLSVIVTIDFVVQLFGGYYAARWALGDKPLRPWIYAYWIRLGLAITSMVVVYMFPKPPVSTAFLTLVTINYISTQFASYETLCLMHCHCY
jgi:MFS transporter, PAT family, solute carrier family 33 (acetyl-CoA transportor), member 1